MDAPSAATLLRVWERGAGQDAVRRALWLLTAGYPDESMDDLARLDAGRRDALLLDLHAAVFGADIHALSRCPACGEQVEITFGCDEVRTAGGAHDGEHRWQGAGYDVTFRLPNSFDLAAAAGAPDVAVARRMLLERCILVVRDAGGEIPLAAVPPVVEDAVVARMAEIDPQANVVLELACPACAHQWQSVLDIATFLWREVHAWAGRTMREVHLLASAYGWREADILAMSVARRNAYLAMVAS